MFAPLAFLIGATNRAAAGGTSDGTWRELFLPAQVAGHGSVYDPIADRFIVACGNGDDGIYHDDVWSMSLASPAGWTEIAPTGPAPGTRTGASTIYDSRRRRLIVFGGFVAPGPGAVTPPYLYSNDVWALALDGPPTWTPIIPAGALPPGRFDHTAIYDPIRDRMIVYGGTGSGLTGSLGDCWSLTLSDAPTWAALPQAYIAQSGHAAIYDPVRDRMVVFSPGSVPFPGNELMALSLSSTPSWSQVAGRTVAPYQRFGTTAVFDAPGDRMVVFGGANSNTPTDEVWAYSFAAPVGWTNITPAGATPGPRERLTSAYDSARRRMLITGGNWGTREVWGLTLSPGGGWTRVWKDEITRPSHRRGHSAVFDSRGQRMVVVGGEDVYDPADAVWAMGLDGPPAWTRLTTTGYPGSRSVAVFDEARRRILLHGGVASSGWSASTWALPLDGPMNWTRITPRNVLPNQWQRHVGILDPVRDRLLVFGANGSAEVWALDLAGVPKWNRVETEGPSPGPLFGADAFYDKLRDRMVVFGGSENGIWMPTAWTWALTLSGTPTWSLLADPPPELLPRYLHAVSYDPLRDRMLVFGGYDNQALMDDLWALDLGNVATWRRLGPGGPRPERRYDHSAIFDPIADRMVVFSGYYNRTSWTLDFGGEPTAFENPADPPGSGPAGDPHEEENIDPVERLSQRGGMIGGGREVDAGEIRATDREAATLSLGIVTPNPVAGPFDVAFSLAGRGNATLELFDLQGRRVEVRQVGALGPGPHRLRLGASSNPPGVMVLRLTQGGVSVARRVAVLR